MFDYCVGVLRFSEGVAYKRIGVARVVRRFPDVGLAISRGELHLSAASLIAPHLSAETVFEWLKATRDKTTREIKLLIADRFPRDEVRSSVRRVSSPSKRAERVLRKTSRQSDLKQAESSPSNPPRLATTGIRQTVLSAAPTFAASSAPMEECRRGTTEALGAARYSVRFTADEEGPRPAPGASFPTSPFSSRWGCRKGRRASDRGAARAGAEEEDWGIWFGAVGRGVGGSKFRYRASFFAGRSASEEEYSRCHSTRGLVERRRPLCLPIEERPPLWI